MRTCTMRWMLFWMMITGSLSSVPGFRSTWGTLHHPALLSCEGECSGAVRWTRMQKLSGDVVVSRCDQTSCSSEEGSSMSHDQYMEGNLSLTVTAAEYRRRGWYRCECDGRDVCDVSLRIQPVEVLSQMHRGDPFVIEVPIPERVEVMFHRSSDDGDDDDDDDDDGGDGGGGPRSSSSVPLCTLEGRKAECGAEFEERAGFRCSVTLSAVKQTDGGVYTVRDTDNDEIISTHTLTLTGNNTDTNSTLPVKGLQDHWNMRRLFQEEFRGLVVGLIMGLTLGVCGAAWILKGCRFLMEKVRRCGRADHDHGMASGKSHPAEMQLIQVCVCAEEKSSEG